MGAWSRNATRCGVERTVYASGGSKEELVVIGLEGMILDERDLVAGGGRADGGKAAEMAQKGQSSLARIGSVMIGSRRRGEEHRRPFVRNSALCKPSWRPTWSPSLRFWKDGRDPGYRGNIWLRSV